MSRQRVLVEILQAAPEGFGLFAATAASARESEHQAEKLGAKSLDGSVDIDPTYAPLPMFADSGKKTVMREALASFSAPVANPDMPATSVVLTGEVATSKLESLRKRKGIRVYPASRMRLMNGGCGSCGCGGRSGQAAGPPAAARDTRMAEVDEFELFDLARMSGGTDCSPFRPGVTLRTIRQLLGVRRVWADGFAGQNVILGMVDEGVNGKTYPVIGGYEPESDDELRFGEAAITSHGSMCAADVLVAAPRARILDYPMLDQATSADGAFMFQLILEQRRKDGTPQVVNNSYGFVGLPSQNAMPEHEAWDFNHPFNRKVREVAASGAAVFFAAGNCGSDCPSGNCKASAIGPGRAINAAAAMADVFTIAAVNSRGERVGYSAQGPALAPPGGFVDRKPDFAAYTHFFGNFGPGRPGGDADEYDSGTSAATPVAAGVACLLLSAFPQLTPARLRQALLQGAMEVGQPGWDPLHGHGIINAGASYQRLRTGEVG